MDKKTQVLKDKLTELFIMFFEQIEKRAATGELQQIPFSNECFYIDRPQLLVRLMFHEETQEEKAKLINLFIDYSLNR